jgi:hypothetical protein
MSTARKVPPPDSKQHDLFGGAPAQDARPRPNASDTGRRFVTGNPHEIVLGTTRLEDYLPVFRYEDQMHMHQKYTVPSVPQVRVCTTWASHKFPLRDFEGKNIVRRMELLQAFKFELMPTGEQARKMRQFAGACRFVYNKALAFQKENHAAG